VDVLGEKNMKKRQKKENKRKMIKVKGEGIRGEG
jgi:hypothetical protein